MITPDRLKAHFEETFPGVPFSWEKGITGVSATLDLGDFEIWVALTMKPTRHSWDNSDVGEMNIRFYATHHPLFRKVSLVEASAKTPKEAGELIERCAAFLRGTVQAIESVFEKPPEPSPLGDGAEALFPSVLEKATSSEEPLPEPEGIPAPLNTAIIEEEFLKFVKVRERGPQKGELAHHGHRVFYLQDMPRRRDPLSTRRSVFP